LLKTGDADDQMVARTVGLVSKDEYEKLRNEVKEGFDTYDDEKDKKKKKKKKKKAGQGALSFGDEEGEGESQVEFKKMSNPDVKAGSLVKSAWLTKDTKQRLANEEKERLAQLEKVREEQKKRSLVFKYMVTLSPIGDDHFTEGLPPRQYRDLEIQLTYGKTVKDVLDEVRKVFRTGPLRTFVGSTLYLVVGSFILDEDMNFLDVENAKYEDGDPIFRLVEEGEEMPASEVQVMERGWYEHTRYYFPQSSWKTYDPNVPYRNPSKTKTFMAVGSEDEIKQWNIAQGVPETYEYKGAVTGRGYAMGR